MQVSKQALCRKKLLSLHVVRFQMIAGEAYELRIITIKNLMLLHERPPRGLQLNPPHSILSL
ncbi:CLUMA_CG013963, isoform A [Clunio marinus]|uniref:CLUMA_CG013963, isoform A n=1 Tax=Clunio marinus TaxID=568069 RepID=A0A1J1ILS5_9DIPT|nr:CLUMA_CG013963, isoform A [Clunio marinus]